MRHLLRIFLTIIAVFSLTMTASTGIIGTKHDLSQATGGGYWAGEDPENQVCIYCHTPHHASTTQQPLWNREETQETFTPYDSPTFQGTFTDPTGQPVGESKLCLSCHDGITALNALLYSYSGPISMVGGFDQLGDVYYPGSPYSPDNMGANIGEIVPGVGGPGNLANDHPVSFIYDEALAQNDGQLQSPAALPDWALHDGNLECTSCHDVHDETYEPFLNMDNTGSALCLTCHLK
jgi:predicted CXXCH cytochrome family protein